MDEEQVGLRAHRKLYGRETCVHCRRDASDSPAILHLQSVYCALIILRFLGAQRLIAILDDGGKRSLRHQRIKAEESNFLQSPGGISMLLDPAHFHPIG